jgi:alkylresorcinol/alkylpyrone synthase/polyketide synthase Type III
MLDLRPRLLSVGTANPPERFSQHDLIDRFQVQDPKIVSLFTSSHISTRHLYLPPPR